jgi:hypothetical protein
MKLSYQKIILKFNSAPHIEFVSIQLVLSNVPVLKDCGMSRL